MRGMRRVPRAGAQERLGSEDGYSPSWAADGQRVVFVGYSGEDEMEFKQDIYVMDANGTGRKDLTASQAHDILPAFSPSGDEIVFSRVTFDRGSESSEAVRHRLRRREQDGDHGHPRAFEYEADWQPVLLPMP
jgi:Tol biopolymer transport system component